MKKQFLLSKQMTLALLFPCPLTVIRHSGVGPSSEENIPRGYKGPRFLQGRNDGPCQGDVIFYSKKPSHLFGPP